MERRTPILAYALAVIGGVAAMFAFVDVAVVTLFLGFAVLGGVFGLVWPGPSWQWGLWTSAALVLTELLSVAIYGAPRPVDILVIVGVPLFAGAGGHAGALIGLRRHAADA